MKNDAHIDFKNKISWLEIRREFLEAFLIQSAYIESLLRRLLNYHLSLNISKTEIRRAIKGKNQHLASVIKFCTDSKWLLPDESGRAKKYFDERNSIIHDLISSNSSNLNKRLENLLSQGKLIIDDHGSLERFMNLAQIEYSRGEMVATNEAIDLSEKEKKILESRFSGKTLEEVGKEFGFSRERARQIQNAAIQKMEGLVRPTVITAEAIARLKDKAIQASLMKKMAAKAALARQKEEALRLANVYIQNVCQKKGIKLSDLQSSSRKANLVLIRHWIAYSLKEDFKLSYPGIGKILNRDHSTIVHAHQRIGHLIKEGKSSLE